MSVIISNTVRLNRLCCNPCSDACGCFILSSVTVTEGSIRPKAILETRAKSTFREAFTVLNCELIHVFNWLNVQIAITNTVKKLSL